MSKSSAQIPGYLGSRRRNRWRMIIGASLVLAAGVALATGNLDFLRSPIGQAESRQPPVSANPWLLPAGPSVVRGACVDQTASSGTSFAPATVQQLADAIAGWPGPQSGPDQLPQRPALDLTVRTVSTHSVATDQQVVPVVVPEVPGLKPPPPPEDVNYAQNKQVWNKAATIRSDAWQRASEAAASSAARLRALQRQLDRDTTSAISGCLAAVAASNPATPTRRLLLASDLQENEAAVSGNYGGSPVLVVQSCPAGTETGCTALAEAWSARLTAQGAGAVRIIRADAASAALLDWMATP